MCTNDPSENLFPLIPRIVYLDIPGGIAQSKKQRGLCIGTWSQWK